MNGQNSKKRKLADVQDNDEVMKENGASKRRKVTSDGFLDCGSVSWSLLLSIFFLSLHKGSSHSTKGEDSNQIVTKETKYCMNYQSCIEMLEVLAHEFGDMIPLETG